MDVLLSSSTAWYFYLLFGTLAVYTPFSSRAFLAETVANMVWRDQLTLNHTVNVQAVKAKRNELQEA